MEMQAIKDTLFYFVLKIKCHKKFFLYLNE